MRDIVVIGASAGGVRALPRLFEGLPADFPASLFIAMHLAPHHVSERLPEILNGRGRLKLRYAVHGDTVLPGTAYLAPPDNHMLLRKGQLVVQRGPRENGFRPSVDALFRTASRAYGARVIGVVLTGALDCGTAGLLSIKERGGLALVQSPEDAEVADMPLSALRHVEVDRVLPVDQMPELLAKLVREPAPESTHAQSQALALLEGDHVGAAADVVCPICQGNLTQAEMKGFAQYRCHVGHVFSETALALEQAEAVDRSLWAAVRALEESAALARRLASKSHGDLKRRFMEREDSDMRNADTLRAVAMSSTASKRQTEDEPAPT